MMSRITLTFSTILVWLPIFLNITNAQEDILKCNIRDGNTEIHLELKKTEQLLANKHLPIWLAKPRKRTHCHYGGALGNEMIPNFVKDRIGDFILYHDVEKSAAVVLFTRIGRLVGIVDTRYLIVSLPVEECMPGVEVGRHVKHIDCDTMDPKKHLRPPGYRGQEPAYEHGEPHRSVPADEESITDLYPEIMVFIPYDTTKILKARYKENYHVAAVMQYIVYFNAVDMLMSKLSTDRIKIRINLAGIVIEGHEYAFNFMRPSSRKPHFIEAAETIDHFVDYASRNLRTFSQDSFDFFFISTSNMMFVTAMDTEAAGLSAAFDIHGIRLKHLVTTDWSGAIVRSSRGYEYITAAHEIAHLMRVDHDAPDDGYCNCDNQCYAIMQEVDGYCPECLKWSDKSVNDLEKFVSQHRDHCYLLNRPRSLHPYGSRMRTLSSSEQCRCYGFDPRPPIEGSENPDIISNDECGRRLVCGKNSEGKSLPLPVDGTPCGINAVCWDRECRKITNAP